MKKALLGASAILAVAVAIILLSGEKNAQSAMMTAEIPIEGLTCQNCVDKVNAALVKLDGVEEVEVSLSANKAMVKYDAAAVTVPNLEASITNLGYKIGAANAATAKEDCEAGAASDCCAAKKSIDKT